MLNPLTESVYQARNVEKTFSMRGEFFRDQTAIIHSMAFRRLKKKTQVFFAPENDHVCTRIEHVLHVATIGATICKGLNCEGWNLDPDLAYAIGLGHDLGHAPFGHSGENALNRKLKNKFEFMHEINSFRVVEYLANNGAGLNLTYGVKDGIINHNGESFEQYLEPDPVVHHLNAIKNRKFIASSYEGCIVRFSDKIAYLGRDIEDALVADFITLNDIPVEIRKDIGTTNGEIIDMLIKDMVFHSKHQTKIGFSDEIYKKLNILKKFNYERIYNHPTIQHYSEMCENILEDLFDHLILLFGNFGYDFEKYAQEPILLEQRFGRFLEGLQDFYLREKTSPEQIICDYISGMTDSFALEAIKQITIPRAILFK